MCEITDDFVDHISLKDLELQANWMRNGAEPRRELCHLTYIKKRQGRGTGIKFEKIDSRRPFFAGFPQHKKE